MQLEDLIKNFGVKQMESAAKTDGSGNASSGANGGAAQ